MKLIHVIALDGLLEPRRGLVFERDVGGEIYGIHFIWWRKGRGKQRFELDFGTYELYDTPVHWFRLAWLRSFDWPWYKWKLDGPFRGVSSYRMLIKDPTWAADARKLR